jgi:hypothetical protein
MHRGKTLLAAALLAATTWGCGLGGGAADGLDPEGVMNEFLSAVRQGDEEKSSALLTTLARQKAGEMEMSVAPPGSDTATFKVLAVEIEGDEAQVGTDWSDVDAAGQMRTDRIVWMMRKEEAGWRIHGMATRVFPDMPPVILNFEDPADMLRKQQAAEEEIARRDAQTESASTGATSSGEATVR